MKIVDANVVLRYLLSDVPQLSTKSVILLENEATYIPFEVIAEIVYVLDKVYGVSRAEISESLINLLKYRNISTHGVEIALVAMKIFNETKLDIIDTFLCAYNKAKGYEVVTFDKELSKYIDKNLK